jgi:hypothetical protein
MGYGQISPNKGVMANFPFLNGKAPVLAGAFFDF